MQVQRGFGEVASSPREVEEELLESAAVSHYFILTHGLGEKISQKMGPGLSGAADDLRQCLQQSLLRSAGYVKTKDGWERSKELTPPVGCPHVPSFCGYRPASMWYF